MALANKMGFWGVLALVVGCQIGSGLFLLPTTLAPFGGVSLLAWGVTGVGAVALALVFAYLCDYLPQTGGPHVYVAHTAGKTAAFYTAWSYWLISWISSIPLITTTLLAFFQLVGERSSVEYTLLALGLIGGLAWLNLRGLQVAGIGEVILSALKVVPLVVIPLFALFWWNGDHFVPFNPSPGPLLMTLNKASLLALWGFIGVELATTPAGNVENPKKTIPKALVLGTSLVALLYFFNTLAMMGLIHPEVLVKDPAPYVTATQMLWGGQTSNLIALLTMVMCIGTLNAWVLASGQIAKGAADEGLFPAFFQKTTPQGGPIWGIGLSCLGMFGIFVFQRGDLMDITRQLIELSSLIFLLIYGICVAVFFVLMAKGRIRPTVVKGLVGAIALCFCGWILWETGVEIWMEKGVQLLYTLFIPASGGIARLLWKTFGSKA